MKKYILLTFSILISLFSIGQVTATYDEVITKQKKGRIDTYTAESGEVFKIGDEITLGKTPNKNFDFIQQNAGIEFYPLDNTASNSKVTIKKMKATMKVLWIYTTKPQGYVYGLVIKNVDGAIKNGEIKSNIMSSDEALEELKKQKDKYDLGLITEEEYLAKKRELAKLIK